MKSIAGSVAFSGSSVLGVSAGVDVFGCAGAKKRNLMAMARAAWRTTTKISRSLLVWRSVALSTGYRLRRRKATLKVKPRPTKIQFRMLNCDHEIRATGIQMRLE